MFSNWPRSVEKEARKRGEGTWRRGKRRRGGAERVDGREYDWTSARLAARMPA